MDMKKQLPPADSADMDWTTFLLRKGISLKHSTVRFSGDSTYLAPLLVYGEEEPCKELHQSHSSQSTSIGLELGGNKIDLNHQTMKDEIEATLKRLTFREERVLVQFWSPHEVGKHLLLTTLDQPFGLGVTDEGLCSYITESARTPFLLVDDHEKEDLSPPARVFKRGLAEWTPDVNSYLPKEFPQLELAVHCSLRGYLALPVFSSITQLCVGVLELMTSSKYMSYAYEVQQLHEELKKENLICPQAFDVPTFYVHNERRQNDLDKMNGFLKVVCDIHSLPLAQTWAVSQHASFVSNEKVIEKSCSSFDTGCVGKVCMSTSRLPFHVKDQGTWSFRKA